MVKLISFDIDRTLEVGDPPVIITMDMVRAIKALGYVIGSGSDRPLGSQPRSYRPRPPIHQRYRHGPLLSRQGRFSTLRADAAVCQAWGPEVFP